MNTAARLAAHLVAFAALVALLRPHGVAPVALFCVFALGVVFLLFAPRLRMYPQSPNTWLGALLYSSFLAAFFSGADFALQALGNSVKPRSALPPALGGLELYWLLVPGIASVAAGALVGALLERRQAKPQIQAPANPVSSAHP